MVLHWVRNYITERIHCRILCIRLTFSVIKSFIKIGSGHVVFNVQLFLYKKAILQFRLNTH
jgi:hypothetical protein